MDEDLNGMSREQLIDVKRLRAGIRAASMLARSTTRSAPGTRLNAKSFPTMADRNLAIRLAVIDVGKVKAEVLNR